MRGKVIHTKLSTILCLCFSLLTLMDYTFYNLIEIPYPFTYIWNNYNKLLPAFFCILLMVVIIYICPGIFNTGSFLTRYMIVLTVSIGAVAIHSLVIYSNMQPLSDLVLALVHYGYLFLAIPLLWYFIVKDEYMELIEKINAINGIWYIISAVQLVLFLFTGTLFIKLINFYRGTLKIPLLSFGNVLILYNFDYIWNNRGKKKGYHIGLLAIGMFCLLLAQNSRGFLLVVVVGIGCSMIASSVSLKKTTYAVISFSAVFSALLYSGIIERFFAKLLTFDSGTTGVRVSAIQYYWSEFMKNPLWGHGIIYDTERSLIASGPKGYFYYSDVGIFGSFAQFGIFTLFIYIWPCIYIIKVAWKIMRDAERRKEYSFAIGLAGYIIASSISLIVTDADKMFLFPFSLAIFEYIDMKLDKKIVPLTE